MFWKMNDARMQAPSMQYRSIVFYHNGDQRQIAEKMKAQEEARAVEVGGIRLRRLLPFDGGGQFEDDGRFGPGMLARHRGAEIEQQRSFR